jgi:preprotein translocase subunit SecA
MGLLQTLFDANERDIKRYRKIVDKVNSYETEMEALSDEVLKAKTAEFQQRVREQIESAGREPEDPKERAAIVNRALDTILPEAFAACREAAKRTLGMRHFDVQLIGGMVQHDGRIAELKTGEGKTLMATLATYLNALSGRGVHVVTVNDYLVKRDAVWMGPLYHALGLSVGILQGHSPETGEGGGTFLYDPEYEDPDPRFKYARPAEGRHEAYACDITYGTNAEFGFDYLRDNMAPTLEMMTQRGHSFAIVDECDSILIDEARTPLIISGTAERSSDMYYRMDKIIPRLEKGEQKKDKDDTTTDEKDYTVDEKAKSASFTERGLDKVEKYLGIENISDPEHLQEMQYAVSALKAHAVFRKDRDYVVRANQEGKPEVVIVDEFTGRLMFGRRWSDGLHQAVEAKEGIKIENEQQTLATITIQNYFRLYSKLAGMTGTAKTEEDEFRKIYALDVVQVPTNKPMIRKDLPDVIYKSEEAKLRGITTEILQLYCRQQPVLVGTRSIEMSERVSRRLEFQPLEILGAIHLLRAELEARSKEIGKERLAEISKLLNTKIDELTISRLASGTKDLGVSLKMLDPGTISALADLLGVEASGHEYLTEALQHGIPHNILNAKYHEQEARISPRRAARAPSRSPPTWPGVGRHPARRDALPQRRRRGGRRRRRRPGVDLSYRRGGKQPRRRASPTWSARTTPPRRPTRSARPARHDRGRRRAARRRPGARRGQGAGRPVHPGDRAARVAPDRQPAPGSGPAARATRARHAFTFR